MGNKSKSRMMKNNDMKNGGVKSFAAKFVSVKLS